MSFSCLVYIVVFLRISPVDVSSSNCLELSGIMAASSLLSLAIRTIESSYVGLPEPCAFLTGRFLFFAFVVNVSGLVGLFGWSTDVSKVSSVDVSKVSAYAAFKTSIFLPCLSGFSLFTSPYVVAVFTVCDSTTGVFCRVKL